MSTATLPAYTAISGTAKVVAYSRAQIGDDTCKRIAELCGAEEATRSLVIEKCGEDNLDTMMESIRKVSPFLVLRSQALIRIVQKLNQTRVIEFASGLSPVGISLTHKSGVMCVETDLPAILREKRLLVGELLADKPQRNLTFQPLDIFDHNALKILRSYFLKPVAYICEGLLNYYNPERVAEFLMKLRSASGVGDMFITSNVSIRGDIETRMRDLKVRSVMEFFAGISGEDILANSFESNQTFDLLALKCGFSNRRQSQFMLAPEIAGRVSDSTLQHLQKGTLFIMTAV